MSLYIQGGIIMVVQHNISAMNANRNLGISTGALSKSTEKLSSGYRINRAGDDAAGLAISEKMRGQIRGLDQASKNSEDGISLVQTAEGALQETQSILQRMRELAVQASNDTNTDDDRTQLQNEIDQLTNEVDRIATTSEFNTKKLLDGSQAGASKYHAGSAGVEGSFTNGYVKLSQVDTSVANTVGIDDVIRISFRKDVTTAGVTLVDVSNPSVSTATAADAARFQSLNGAQVSISIDNSAGDATVTIANAAYTGTTASAGSAITTAVTFKISGATNIKADDVITISLSKMTPTGPAENGSESMRLQVGANAGQEMDLSIASMKAKDLGIVKTSTTVDIDCSYGGAGNNIGKALDVTSQAKASLAIEAYDGAIQRVSTQRAKLGAIQNRLEHTINNLDTSAENLQAAESAIRDVDMAEEMTNYSKNNILMQAGQSMLAQANQSTQGALSLLG
jgi:flagellin